MAGSPSSDGFSPGFGLHTAALDPQLPDCYSVKGRSGGRSNSSEAKSSLVLYPGKPVVALPCCLLRSERKGSPTLDFEALGSEAHL